MSMARHHNEWLSLVEAAGPFLSMPVLLRVFPQGLDAHDPDLSRGLSLAYEEWADNQHGLRPDPAIHTAWLRYVLQEVLGFPGEVLRSGSAIPPSLMASIPEHGETLRPDLVVQRDGEAPRLLIQLLPPTQKLDQPLLGQRWKASPDTRMTELLRASGVHLGLLTNGEHWMLVYAQPGETTGFSSWYAPLWLEEPLTLRAFRSLLGVYRFFGVPDGDMLEALLRESAAHQHEVTDQLGYQVRDAVEVLVQALDRIDKDRDRALLRGVDESKLYEAALTVMMRLVFLFWAEEQRLLLLGTAMYDQHYAVSTLHAQLREAADLGGEEVLERRFDAWGRLLATFRAVFGGIQHEYLRLPAYGGNLFDPDRFPFLEGRALETNWRQVPARPLPVDNRTVLHLLVALQFLRVSVPGGSPELRRLSFRALDVEQIGHVYEGLLDHQVKRSTEPMLGLAGNKDHEAEVALSILEAFGVPKPGRPRTLSMFIDEGGDATPQGNTPLLAFLCETTGRSERALSNALAAPLSSHDLDALRAACDNDAALLARLRPFAGLLRRDSFGRLIVITKGSNYVTAGTDRRSSGTHYTPRALTEPIVRHTLEPLIYDGPADGKPKEAWKLRSAEYILGLKVCDMTMGSGAFLVQACRYLSERLVEAWEAEGVQSTSKPETNDNEELLRYARRLVADHCLYGVDKNPLAVEMAKLSLWLITLQKDRPFSFLDHTLRCGDSLLGIANVDQLMQWSLAHTGETTATFLTEPLSRALLHSLALRYRIRNIPVIDVRDAQRKAEWLRQADEEMQIVKLAADLLIAAALHNNKKQRVELSAEFLHRITLAIEDRSAATRDVASRSDAKDELAALRREANHLLREHRPFHWPLELPEVFIGAAEDYFSTQALMAHSIEIIRLLPAVVSQIEQRTDKSGHTAIIGNPPFVGGRRIRETLGDNYRDALYELYKGSSGNADLSAFFFLRSFRHLLTGGTLGLIATNTISQGDTRKTGLDTILIEDGVVYNADIDKKWPGKAAVVVNIVHIGKQLAQLSSLLNGRPVNYISSYLEGRKTLGNPYPLMATWGKSFQGSVVVGMGFVLEPHEAEALIAKDQRNREVLFPFLNGEDLNSRPDQSPSRWVINFRDWPLEQAERYPDLMAIVREKVKPEREKVNREAHRRYWWHYGDKRPTLYATIGGMARVLAVPLVSKYAIVAWQPIGYVFSHALGVIASDEDAVFALTQSTLHEEWARAQGSTLETRMRYTPSDCFETFPFPEALLDDAQTTTHNTQRATLDAIGERYHEHRRRIMLARQEGLTKTYNRFHNPREDADDIAELRRLHVAMDAAVAGAYGWSDLDLGHSFHQTKQGLRYTISEAARRTLLDRLLVLNHHRYAEEVAQGLHDKGAKKAKVRTKKPVEATPIPIETPQLVMDLDEVKPTAQPEQDAVIDFGEALRRRKPKKAAEAPVAYSTASAESSQLSPLDRHVILLARIIQRHRKHGFQKTLGHVKAEKIAHVVEAHCNAELERAPLREMAGPADFQRLLSVVSRAKHLGVFQDTRRSGEQVAYQFLPLGGLDQTAARMKEAFGQAAAPIDKVIKLFVGLKTNESEIVATLYAAWNDLLADGEAITEERLFDEFYGWSKSKRDFQLGELRRMKLWMETVGLVPSGKAKRTLPLKQK